MPRIKNKTMKERLTEVPINQVVLDYIHYDQDTGKRGREYEYKKLTIRFKISEEWKPAIKYRSHALVQDVSAWVRDGLLTIDLGVRQEHFVQKEKHRLRDALAAMSKDVQVAASEETK